MPFVRANPNQYLLAGRNGKLENRGSAIQAYLLPGTVHVLVPSTKQEASFAFTQESKDGIPLRFKGIVIYRVTDPVAAASLFDFSHGVGTDQVSGLLVDVCYGELRHAVSHMTMAECIEQRKTTLSEVVRSALEETVHPAEGDWGITIEVAQLAQVFIVDGELRQQLEAEVRNEIRLKSDQSGIQTAEELELARLASDRRTETERVAARQRALELQQQLFQSEMVEREARVNTSTPVRLLELTRERDILREELDVAELRNRARALAVDHDLLQERAEQELRREMLPLEQAPLLVESASKVLQGTNLSIYGGEAQLLGQLAPVFDMLAGAVRRAAPAVPPGSGEDAN